MNKATKITLIIVGVLAALGVLFCIVAVALGANLYNVKLGTAGKNIAGAEHSFKDITDLNIDLDVGEMIVKEADGDEFSVHAEDVNESYVCEEKDGTLFIRHKEVKKFRFWSFGWNNREAKIVLEVPRGTVFDETQMVIGVGKIELSDFQSKNLSIDCGVGAAYLEGRITGDCNLNCGVGEIKMKLSGNEEDYDYEVDCGIGEVRIGDRSYTALGHSSAQNNHADNNMNIECGVGSVKVTFVN